METTAFARAALYHDVPLVQLNEFLTKLECHQYLHNYYVMIYKQLFVLLVFLPLNYLLHFKRRR